MRPVDAAILVDWTALCVDLPADLTFGKVNKVKVNTETEVADTANVLFCGLDTTVRIWKDIVVIHYGFYCCQTPKI